MVRVRRRRRIRSRCSSWLLALVSPPSVAPAGRWRRCSQSSADALGQTTPHRAPACSTTGCTRLYCLVAYPTGIASAGSTERKAVRGRISFSVKRYQVLKLKYF